MKLSQISEKRSNPELNTGKQGHPGAIEFLSSIKDLGNYGVSMTSVAKLGINPQSKFSTPVGIYFYPAEYYYDTKKSGGQLEFQDDAAYIQIFQITGNILRLDEADVDDYKKVLDTLMGKVPELSKAYNKSGDQLHATLGTLFVNSGKYSKIKTYGGQIWFVLYRLADYLADSAPVVQKKKNDDEDDAFAVSTTPKKVTADTEVIIWNKLLRMIGYSAVIDMGAGIIHENEPIQGVVLDPTKIKHVATIDNNVLSDVSVVTEWQKVYDTRRASVDWVRAVMSLYQLPTDGSEKIVQRIMHYVINILNRDPSMFSKFKQHDIKKLMSLTSNQAQKNFIELGFILSEFHKKGNWITKLLEMPEDLILRYMTEIQSLRDIDQVLQKYQSDHRAKAASAALKQVFDKVAAANN